MRKHKAVVCKGQKVGRDGPECPFREVLRPARHLAKVVRRQEEPGDARQSARLRRRQAGHGGVQAREVQQQLPWRAGHQPLGDPPVPPPGHAPIPGRLPLASVPRLEVDVVLRPVCSRRRKSELLDVHRNGEIAHEVNHSKSVGQRIHPAQRHEQLVLKLERAEHGSDGGPSRHDQPVV